MNIEFFIKHPIRLMVGILIILIFIFFCLPVNAQEKRTQIAGTITTHADGTPLYGATVADLETGKTTTTDNLGRFVLEVPEGDGTIKASFIGYKDTLVAYTPETSVIRIALVPISNTISEVMVNTGYQYIPKERATGSFDLIDNEQINRSISTDIISRLENITPGLIFNHGDEVTNAVSRDNPFIIRGRSTITADAQPLVVLDDFPYDGDLGNINPNDIESVTILKDAAAASIWGARAGNGVIVITTKKGTTEVPKISLVSNISITGRPDLYNLNSITSKDRIEVEQFLFENGRYASAANPTNATARFSPIPGAVELMINNPSDLQQRLMKLGRYDVLEDISKYLYQTSARQHYNLNVSGEQKEVSYYLSGGLDRNLSNLVGETYNKVSIRTGNSFKVHDRLRINASVNYFHITEEKGNNRGFGAPAGSAQSFSPYTRLIDESGNTLPVYQMLRKGFVDTAGSGDFLDWLYRPLDEIKSEQHSIQRREYLVNIGSVYKIVDGLDVQMKYQFQNQIEKAEDLFREQSFYARNLVNDFTQINYSTGALSYPFPKGAIRRVNNTETASHQGRAQLNFKKSFDNNHSLVALAGFEIRKLTIGSNRNENLGYNEQTGNLISNIDTETRYRINTTGTTRRISLVETTAEFRDNFISYFSNAAYTFKHRYTLSGSFRKDEANLFGLNINQKGTPLWSVGGAWETSKEQFYNLTWLPNLKIRASYGVSGNISRKASAKATVTLRNSGASNGLPYARLGTPANRDLSWETVKQLNLGIDFASKNNRLSGTIEYYYKNATNLLTQTPVDPSYGVSSMYMNVASMKGRGLDIQLRSINLNTTLKWETSLIYSYSSTKMTDYLMPVASTGRTYLPISLANPIKGRPLYSVFALPWEGLDSETGDPIGRFEGKRSTDYGAIYNSTPLEGLIFKGTAQPKHFGAIMNRFQYRNFDFSFNVSFKAGHYFRRPNFSYSVLFNGFSGHADYANRWQKPGDETRTDVPSMMYPANANRDNFYKYSDALVERGDHIRLEDITVSYHLKPNRLFKAVRVFTYISDLGMIWAANSRNIDPYFNRVPKIKPTFSFGMNLTF